MLNAVEHDRADRDLALVGLAAGLGGDQPREQVEVSALRAAAVPLGRHAERGERQIADLPVDLQAVLLLEPAHGLLGLAAVDAVDRAAVVAPVFEPALDLRHGRAGGALFVQVGRGPLRQGDDEDVDGKDQRQREHQALFLLTHAKAPHKHFPIVCGGRRKRCVENYARVLISSRIFAAKSSKGIAPRSSPLRVRTATLPLSASRSPTTSM